MGKTRMRRVAIVSGGVGVAAALAVAGAAQSKPAAHASSRLTVFAAASLTTVFPQIDRAPRYTFAGSDMLATQITQGAPADVFAAASPKQPEALFKQGLVAKPVVFASNRLVLIVPKGNPAHLHKVADITKKGVKLVIGDATVPIGAYTRTVLGKLHLTAALKNVRSNETDVKAVAQKVALGEADAGFVYVTDTRAVAGKVRAIGIPSRGQPTVKYEIAVVKSGPNQAGARAFIAAVRSPRGQATLKAAGFGRP
jgi:molybdate transport system substrate-binding protein